MEAAFKVLVRVYTTATPEQVERKVIERGNCLYLKFLFDACSTPYSSTCFMRQFDKASRLPIRLPFGND